MKKDIGQQVDDAIVKELMNELNISVAQAKLINDEADAKLDDAMDNDEDFPEDYVFKNCPSLTMSKYFDIIETATTSKNMKVTKQKIVVCEI